MIKLNDILVESMMNEMAVKEAQTIQTALRKLVKDIKSKDGVDKRAYEKHSDGEILAIIIKGILNDTVSKLDNPKDFWKYMKK